MISRHFRGLLEQLFFPNPIFESCSIFTHFLISVFYVIMPEKKTFMTHRLARLTIDLPASEHKRLKMAASLMDLSMKQLVLMSVDEFIHKKRRNKPLAFKDIFKN
jgi:hypothetical protein